MAMENYNSHIEKRTSLNVFRFCLHQRAANKKVKDVPPSGAVASSWNFCVPVAEGASLKMGNLQSPSIGRYLNEGGQIFLGFAG